MSSEIKVKFLPSTHWWKQSKWELLEDYVAGNGFVVPKGFITDGASIPSVLRSTFSATGRYFGAAIVHDYVLSDAIQPANLEVWKKANKEFDNEMKHIGISKWRLLTLLGGVISWGYVREYLINHIVKLYTKYAGK